MSNVECPKDEKKWLPADKPERLSHLKKGQRPFDKVSLVLPHQPERLTQRRKNMLHPFRVLRLSGSSFSLM